MSQSRTQLWSLSQEANKSSGKCSVCLATRQLHQRDGTVHKHGPRDKPCQGSHKPPLDTTAGPRADLKVTNKSNGSTDHLQQQSSDQTTQQLWSPPAHGLIKHIPKSARAVCAS